MSDLKTQTIGGIKWNSLGTILSAGMQMLKLFILARILSKSDFGLLAIATMFLGFTEIFANMGIATGLIHKQNITREQYSSVYWFNLILSGFLYGLLCAATPLIANYYNEPTLLKLIPLLSVQLIISALGKMFYTFKIKELDFKFISIVTILGAFVSVVATIVLALLGYGVYSMAYGAIIQALIVQGVFAVAGLKQYRILFHFRLKEISDILIIGGYQLATQVIDYAAAKLDVFLIGRFFGSEVLGLYNLAKEFVMKIIQVINPIITNVAAPAFARFQDDLAKMRHNYGNILTMLSFINFPIFAAFFVFAEPVTLIIYGKEMMDVAWFLRILSIWGLFQSVGNPAVVLMVSLGRTDLGFIWTLVRIFFTLIVTLICCKISIEALTYGQVILAFGFMFAYWKMMVYKMIQLPLSDYLKSVSYPLLAAVTAIVLPAIAMFFCHQIVLQLCLLCLFGLLYLLFYYTTKRDYLEEISGFFIKKKK